MLIFFLSCKIDLCTIHFQKEEEEKEKEEEEKMKEKQEKVEKLAELAEEFKHRKYELVHDVTFTLLEFCACANTKKQMMQ